MNLDFVIQKSVQTFQSIILINRKVMFAFTGTAEKIVMCDVIKIRLKWKDKMRSGKENPKK